MWAIFRKAPKNRHPERSATQISSRDTALGGAESKDPEVLISPMLLRAFQPPKPGPARHRLPWAREKELLVSCDVGLTIARALSCPVLLTLTWFPHLSLPSENSFRAYGVHAHAAVDQLRNVHVDRDAGQHIGVVAAQVLLLYQEVDHVTHCQRGGFLKVRTESHADVAGGRLCSGP